MARVESPPVAFDRPGAHAVPAFQFSANAERAGFIVDATNQTNGPMNVIATLELAFPPYTDWRQFGRFIRAGLPANERLPGYDPAEDGAFFQHYVALVSVLVAPFQLRANIVLGGPPFSGSMLVWAE